MFGHRLRAVLGYRVKVAEKLHHTLTWGILPQERRNTMLPRCLLNCVCTIRGSKDVWSGLSGILGPLTHANKMAIVCPCALDSFLPNRTSPCRCQHVCTRQAQVCWSETRPQAACLKHFFQTLYHSVLNRFSIPHYPPKLQSQPQLHT